MKIKDKFKRIRDNYIINQVRRAKIPALAKSETVRLGITFSGRVQKVGFRLEVSELAKRLCLTGFCQNLPSGEVYCEIQGEREKINYLVSFMESLWRIGIKEKIIAELPVASAEEGFLRK